MQPLLPHFTPNSTLLESAKRRVAADVQVTVDPDAARLHLIRKLQRLVDVSGENAGGEAVRRVIAPLNHFIQRLVLENLLHWAEDLLLGNAHVVGDVGEDGRLDEVALAGEAFSTSDHTGALLLPALNQIEDLLRLRGVNLWPLGGLRLEGAAENLALGNGRRLLDELFVDRFVNIGSGCCAAALALVHQTAGAGDLSRGSNVSVLGDYQRRLSAQLQADAF